MPTLDSTGRRSRFARSPRVVYAALLLAIGACTNNVEEPPKPVVKKTPASAATAPAPPKGDGAISTSPAIDAGTQFPLGPLPEDAPFEGNVGLKVTEIGPENTRANFTFLVKGKKLRWDIVGGGGTGAVIGYRIYDGEKRKFFSVLSDEPSVFVTDANRLVGDGGSSYAYKLTPFAPEPKGAVLGMPCDRMLTDDDHSHYDVCLTSALPTLPFMLLGGPMATALPFSSLLDQRGTFPISVSARPLTAAPGKSGGGGAPRGSLKLVKVDRGRVPNAAFDLPAYPSIASAQLPPVRKLR